MNKRRRLQEIIYCSKGAKYTWPLLFTTFTLVSFSQAQPCYPARRNVAPSVYLEERESKQTEMLAAKRGVELLNKILARMRNIPQLAMASGAESISGEVSKPTNEPDFTEHSLLIQPKALRRATVLASDTGGSIISISLKETASLKDSSNAKDTAKPKQIIGSESNLSNEKIANVVSPNLWERSDQNANPLEGTSPPKEADIFLGESPASNNIDKKIISNSPLITEFTTAQAVKLTKTKQEQSLNKRTTNLFRETPSKESHLQKANAIAHLAAFRSKGMSKATSTKYREESTNVLASVPTSDLNLALYPPTVITGIPLVRLGNLEKEVTTSLKTIGTIHKDLIDQWSVLTIDKPKTNECLLQIFTQQGLVEAIRIFDRSILRPDFGIRLGDELATIKHKFGEPAFILSESTAIKSQNYIYPISQIGFQLQRPSTGGAPKVVSILIFNAH